jgi:heme-degrading monooxygenase HmoA
MVIVVFRSRLRSEISSDFQDLANRMLEIAESMPGFISYDVYVSPDEERSSIIKFESLETCGAWRTHPEHLEAQRRGRDEFYSEYSVWVTESVRENHFRL